MSSPPARVLPLEGIAWMVVCTLMFVVVTGIVRLLGSDLPAAQSAFIRYAFGMVLLAPAVIRMVRARPDAELIKFGALRGLAHTFGVTLWFYAMARIPIAEVTAIGYTTPIVVTIGAAIFLGEKLRLRRLMGVAAGLLGALIIIRPGFEEVSIGQLAQLGTAPLFAASYLMTKSLTGRMGSADIVVMLTISVTIFLAPLAALDWVQPSLRELGFLFACAVAATFGHYAMTRALAAAPVSVTQPVIFLQLVWATALGYFAFGEAIDPYVILGGTIIVVAASWISYRENQLSKRITPLAGEPKWN